MISLGIRGLGFQTICFIQRLSAAEELGGSNSILSGLGTRFEVHVLSWQVRGAVVALGWELALELLG